MGKLDNAQVAALGKAIADDHLNGKGSINDLVQKLATESGWNPEQIHRVGRKANVSVFESKFAAMSRDPDRIVAFDIGDTDEVIRRIQGNTTTKTAAAEAYFPELPDQVGAIRENEEYEIVREPVSVKTAMDTSVVDTHTPGMVEHYRLAREKLHERCGQLENRWVQQIHKVAGLTRQLNWDHDAFEHNAAACFGSDVIDELAAVREALGLEPGEFDKTAADHALENALGHDGVDTVYLKVAMELREEILKTRRARDLAQETYQSLEKKVKQ